MADGGPIRVKRKPPAATGGCVVAAVMEHGPPQEPRYGRVADPGWLPARSHQLCRWECLLNATVVYDHVAPFARRAIPKRRNHRTPITANLDDRIAVVK